MEIDTGIVLFLNNYYTELYLILIWPFICCELQEVGGDLFYSCRLLEASTLYHITFYLANNFKLNKYYS